MDKEAEVDMEGQQRAEEARAYLRACVRTPRDQPLPPEPAWAEEVRRQVAAEKAAGPAPRHTKTVAEIFGRVKTTGPFTAAEARVGLDDRAEAQDQTENETEDYEQ
ncbi:hypothetical protein [Acidithiobacillus ferrooxidans]|uniref:hypothetical protein n=1 Tax=Acidithiobacillus ferrooxidans TaxID=920 RepID=UPI000A623F97|nr:hypothetical protein [Acidithiobacillus ferrooxidans]